MKPEIVDGFVVVGDEAWTVEEWEQRERDNRQKRERWVNDPEYRARRTKQHREWKAKHREEWRAYNREWMRRYRRGGAVASLHDLRCTGPTRATGCRCTHKIRLYARMEEAA